MTASTPTWYGDGLRFACQQCGSCCRVEGFVWVDPEAIRRLAAHLDLSLDSFGRRYLRQVDGRYALVDKANHECVFWSDGCKVYEARPPQCRTFPFWQRQLASPEAWAEVAAECRGIGRGRVYPAEEIERLASGSDSTDDGAPRECGGICGGEDR